MKTQAVSDSRFMAPVSSLAPLQFLPQDVEEKHFGRSHQVDPMLRASANHVILVQQRFTDLPVYGQKRLAV
jgi:hypothetical protein